MSRDLADKYGRFARWYDWSEGAPELVGLSRLRRRVLQQASGKVLAVRSCCWSTAEATASGLDVGRTGMQIDLPNRLAAIGTANR